ncbi:MAG: hypothetical protein HOP02_11110 [Methylococcaceae bacterium]|nr:hypothetical protein [Methylococcaceae bacterium]
MKLDNKFSAYQLAIINEQAALYTCACPIHVSLQIANLRKLFNYQLECMANETASDSDIQMQVHRRIAEVTKQAHQLMEQCLDEVLDLEGWDKTKMEMPAGLRKRINGN